MIDDAHTVREEAAFETLRRLLNFELDDRPLASLILLGPPELREAIGRHASLDQRLPVRLDVPPLDASETASYIQFRLQRAGAAR